MNKQQLSLNTYHHQELESSSAVWKQTTSALVQEKGKGYAGKKQPHATGDDIYRYLGFFKEMVKQRVREIDRILHVTPLLFSIKQTKEKREREVFKLQSQLEDLQQQSAQIRTDSNQSAHKLVRFQSMGILLIVLLLATAEGFLSYRPFLYLTGSSFASFIISVVFAVIWSIAAHKFASYWNQGEGFKRMLRRAAMIIGCTAIFYAIAHLRALQRACSRAIMNDEPVPGFFQVNYTETLILTLVGWLFFLGGVWLAQRSPSWIEIKQAVIQQWNKRKAKRLEQKIASIQTSIEAENNKVAEEEHKAVVLLNLRKMAVKDVEGYLYHLAEEFKEVNHSTRVDGVYPDCFDEPLVFNIDTMIPNIKEDVQGYFNEAQNGRSSTGALILIPLILSGIFTGCSRQQAGIYEKEVICLVDGTDSGAYKPSFEEIKPLLNLTDQDNGISFKARTIGDIDFGKTFEVSLTPKKGEDETTEERYNRKNQFFRKARKGYIDICGQATQKDHSIIYRVIANELNQLSKSKGNGIAVIASDLQENSEILNVYKFWDAQLLTSAPTKVKERFLKQVPLEPLQGITVYFLFKPRDFKENTRYRSMLSIYEDMLKSKGAVVKTDI